METLLPLNALPLLLYEALFLLLFALVGTVFSIVKKRADFADVTWGLGIVLAAWLSPIFIGFTTYGLIVNFFVTLWGARLSLHIYSRHLGKEEDFRYIALMEKWGKRTPFRIFTHVFLLQGMFQYVLLLPILSIHLFSSFITPPFFTIGAALWIFGFTVEAIGDYQLQQFLEVKENRGKLCTTGLWGLSRHPNYFGEIVQWWAIWLIGALLPYGWILILSPLILSYLIIFISGVVPLEQKMKDKKEFLIYKETTPMLFPSAFWGFLTLALSVLGIWSFYL